MHVFNYNATFSPADLVILELEDIHRSHLDFKILIKATTKLSRGHSIFNY